MVEGGALWPVDAGRVFVRLVGDDGDALHAFRGELAGDLVDRRAAFDMLAAGHGDGIVIEDLVGDVGAGRQREADGERAGMGIGAVAEILEDMAAVGEGATPTHCAPSPPIWVKPSVLRSIQIDMK